MAGKGTAVAHRRRLVPEGDDRRCLDMQDSVPDDTIILSLVIDGYNGAEQWFAVIDSEHVNTTSESVHFPECFLEAGFVGTRAFRSTLVRFVRGRSHTVNYRRAAAIYKSKKKHFESYQKNDIFVNKLPNQSERTLNLEEV